MRLPRFRSPGTQQIVKEGKHRWSSYDGGRGGETCLCRCPNNSPLNPINSSLGSVGGRNNNTLPFTMRWRGCLIPRSPRPRAQASPPSPPLTQSPTAGQPPLRAVRMCPFVSRFICLSSHLSRCLFSSFSHSSPLPSFLPDLAVGSFSFFSPSLSIYRDALSSSRFLCSAHQTRWGPATASWRIENRQPPNGPESGIKKTTRRTQP